MKHGYFDLRGRINLTNCTRSPTVHYIPLVYVLFLQLWRDILSLEVPKNRKVSESWNVCVSNVIKGRVMQVRVFIHK